MEMLSAGELNYVVYRYLLESVYQNTAFALYHEAGIDRVPRVQTHGHLVPHSTLITLVQKGLHFIEMEANLDADSEDNEYFSFTDPLDLMTKEAAELQQIVKEQKKAQKEARGKGEGPSSAMEEDKEGDNARSSQEEHGIEQITRAIRHMRTPRVLRKNLRWNLHGTKDGKQ